ncbi:MAG: HAMP domain-containing sensor histidine kinase [Myroides sp.]|nr:HAMP domain-containing sensor histidine kinase [Myroides sp.]
MRVFFGRFWKTFLFALTVLFVLLFQSYWLWNTFQNKKVEILERTKLEMQQVLINQLIINENLDNDQKMDDEIKFVIQEKLSKVLDIQKLIELQGEVEILDENDNILFSNEHKENKSNLDSFLYFEMKPYMLKTYGDDNITVYFESEKKIKPFPVDHSVNLKNTTAPVSSLGQPAGSYRIHIENLRLIVLSKMYDSILFSVLYLLLFLGTVSLLLHNVKINRRLLKNKEVFTRNVTHEFKIPISTIMIAAEGFEKYNIIEEPEAAKKYINTIKRATHQLSLFVESILQHSKAENGIGNSTEESINLSNLFKEVESDLTEIISNKKAIISFPNFSKNLCAKGNHNQMKQIFINLFENSIKYADQNPVIIVDGHQLNNRVIITIKDNGIGIPKKYTEEIFQPYFRVTHEDIHEMKGFGLGLSFVRSALKNQDGKIHVKKSDSEGTVMELNLAAYE